MYTQGITGLTEAPIVVYIHIDKGRNVKCLPKPVSSPVIKGMLIVCGTQYITMALSPGRIMNLHNDGFDRPIRLIVAIIETGRIETVAEISQMGQQADGSLRSLTEMVFNKIRYCMIQRNSRITEVIPAAKAGQIEPFVSPQGMDIKKCGQFGQIEQHEKQPVLKHVR